MGQFRQLLDLIDESLSHAASRGLAMREAEDEKLDGRTVRLDGKSCRQFFSCSYLGLELHPKLRQGAISAVERFGTQFSSSRSYISAPLYGALEEHLDEITGGHVMVAPNTTLGSLSTLPVIIAEEDAVLLDHQVHQTVQLAVPQLKALGIPVSMIRHGDLDRLEEEIRGLRSRHRRIWYLADGIYSMFGNLAPLRALGLLLDRYEELHLYLDDAHGTSWTGERGRGFVLEELGSRERVVVAISLNKSFGAGGGAVVFPDRATRDRVRLVGGPMMFTGPLQPPVLGAALASAKLHLSEELPPLQAELAERIHFVNRRAVELELPLANTAEVPIRYLCLGPRDAAVAMCERLLERGFIVNGATFPAVPAHKSGIRFTVTRHVSKRDLDDLLTTMAELLPEALEAGATTRADLNRAFRLGPMTPGSRQEMTRGRSDLVCQHAHSIDELDPREWNAWMAGRGSFDAQGCRTMEALFAQDRKPEERARFHYLVVREATGEPVLATVLSEILMKDDMFAEASVSKAAEARRRRDPAYLTSRALVMGCPLTEGDHLFLDRGRDWRGALQLLCARMDALAEETKVDLVVIRDLDASDEELRSALAEHGYHASPMPTSMVAPVPESRQAMLAGLSRRAKRFQSDKVEPFLDRWEARVLEPGCLRPGDPTVAHLFGLYRNVWERSFHLNTFALPEDFPALLLDHPGWEFLTLHHRDEPEGPPRAFLAARIEGDSYAPLVIGLDYRYVASEGVYRQCIHHALESARAHGCSRVLMGMGAELEKRRFGAVGQKRRLFIRAKDHYHADVLAMLAAEVHLKKGS